MTEEDIEILMENDEKIAHEPILIDEVSSEVINQLGNLRIKDFRWYIASEDSTHVSNPVGTNVISVYAPDPAAESFNLLGEDSNAGLELGLEDGLGYTPCHSLPACTLLRTAIITKQSKCKD